MNAIEIQRNGAIVCVMGTTGALMLAADVSVMVSDPSAATLDLHGMNDLGAGRQSHIRWFDELVLADGDILDFRFVNASAATAPTHEVATDSEEHLAEQRWYEEQMRESPMVVREIERVRPNATLELFCPGSEPILATLEGGREFISLHVFWDQWRPERCRVSLSSFSQQEAISRSGSREWFNANLQVGEQCAVKVGSKRADQGPSTAAGSVV